MFLVEYYAFAYMYFEYLLRNVEFKMQIYIYQSRCDIYIKYWFE